MCVGGDWTGCKVVVGHGIGVGLPLVCVVNFERMARGVQLFPRGNHSIQVNVFTHTLTEV